MAATPVQVQNLLPLTFPTIGFTALCAALGVNYTPLPGARVHLGITDDTTDVLENGTVIPDPRATEHAFTERDLVSLHTEDSPLQVFRDHKIGPPIIVHQDGDRPHCVNGTDVQLSQLTTHTERKTYQSLLVTGPGNASFVDSTYQTLLVDMLEYNRLNLSERPYKNMNEIPEVKTRFSWCDRGWVLRGMPQGTGWTTRTNLTKDNECLAFSLVLLQSRLTRKWHLLPHHWNGWTRHVRNRKAIDYVHKIASSGYVNTEVKRLHAMLILAGTITGALLVNSTEPTTVYIVYLSDAITFHCVLVRNTSLKAMQLQLAQCDDDYVALRDSICSAEVIDAAALAALYQPDKWVMFCRPDARPGRRRVGDITLPSPLGGYCMAA